VLDVTFPGERRKLAGIINFSREMRCRFVLDVPEVVRFDVRARQTYGIPARDMRENKD